MRLPELWEEFVIVALAENRSPVTIDSHEYHLKRFLKYLEAHDLPDSSSTITPRIVREYLLYLQQQGYATQTIVNNFSTLRALFNHGVNDELITNNPTRRIKPPKLEYIPVEVFTPKDIEQILNACDRRTFMGMRDFTIVLLLFDSGIRASELLSLEDSDIDWSSGLIRVYGKGAKVRSVPVSARTMRVVRLQINRRKKEFPETESLFVNDEGIPLTRSGLTQMLTRLGKRTGMHIHAHKFRHSFAVNALRNGAREYDIQDCLGHTTLEMTKRYAKQQSGEDLARQHKRFAPASEVRFRI